MSLADAFGFGSGIKAVGLGLAFGVLTFALACAWVGAVVVGAYRTWAGRESGDGGPNLAVVILGASAFLLLLVLFL